VTLRAVLFDHGPIERDVLADSCAIDERAGGKKVGADGPSAIGGAQSET
jgi:hypothetical protein